MRMYNPPHPGEFILATYMEPFNLSCRQLAAHLGVAASTLSRILKSQSGISPEMALRLSQVVGRSAESWLSMQDNFDLFHARNTIRPGSLKKLNFDAA